MNGGECVVKGGDNPGQDIVWQPRRGTPDCLPRDPVGHPKLRALGSAGVRAGDANNRHGGRSWSPAYAGTTTRRGGFKPAPTRTTCHLLESESS